MKFTSGYILGAGTVVAVGAAFVGGMATYAYARYKLEELVTETTRAPEKTLADLLFGRRGK